MENSGNFPFGNPKQKGGLEAQWVKVPFLNWQPI